MRSISTNLRKQANAESLALSYATRWTDTALRFLASQWAAVSIETCQGLDALLKRRGIELPPLGPEVWPNAGLFNLYQLILEAAESETRPSIDTLIRLMRRRRWTAADIGIGGGDLARELRVLECEQTTAGFESYARHLCRFAERAKLARRLRDIYRKLLSDQDDTEDALAEVAALAAGRDLECEKR